MLRFNYSSPTRSGFTLVELALVLAVLGLLVGGILAGRSLLEASESQAVIAEYTKYSAAAANFKQQYKALPGDMADATSYWGVSADCGGLSTNGTCDGNGNQRVGSMDYDTSDAENTEFWHQLQLAGQIEAISPVAFNAHYKTTLTYTAMGGGGGGGCSGPCGPDSYTPIGGNLCQWEHVVDPCSCLATITVVTCPFSSATPYSGVSAVTNGLWKISSTASGAAGNSTYFAGDLSNYLQFAASQGNPLLKPEDAWNIDTKLDDGMPGTGNVMASHWNNACALASSEIDTAAKYNLTSSIRQCTLLFVRQWQ